ncbi:ATP-binding protein [Streptomyces sp. NPDC050617]|uniref:ATP-binding protein n=1 Tax=Streptomyces sp. NPDC050617 TaxID=3154628 RepID=UPI003441D896
MKRTAGADDERPAWLGGMTLYPKPGSVSTARSWFREFVAKSEPSCSLDDCVLMVSELVTNAITYGEAVPPCRVRVEWYRAGDSLRVEVHNPGRPDRVRLARPGAGDVHGRGLFLVECLADEWSAGCSVYGGTVVAFVLRGAWPVPSAC